MVSLIRAGKDAVAFSANRRREDIDKDRVLILALVKSIEIIGEASTKISAQCKMDHPQIP